jgi:hypothetical protein
VMFGSVRRCQLVRPSMLLVWAMGLMEVIYCLVSPLDVMVVLRHVLMGSVGVAIIAYDVGSSSEMTKFLCWKDLSFLALGKTNDPSGAARSVIEACEYDVVNSRVDDMKAPTVCMACYSTS